MGFNPLSAPNLIEDAVDQPAQTLPMTRTRSTAPMLVLLTASTGCAMTVLDINIVAMVLPSIARGFGASFADIQWVVSAYVLFFASLLLPAGAIADRFGRKRTFLAGIGVFTLASLLCGLAVSPQTLYMARALQGRARPSCCHPPSPSSATPFMMWPSATGHGPSGAASWG